MPQRGHELKFQTVVKGGERCSDTSRSTGSRRGLRPGAARLARRARCPLFPKPTWATRSPNRAGRSVPAAPPPSTFTQPVPSQPRVPAPARVARQHGRRLEQRAPRGRRASGAPRARSASGHLPETPGTPSAAAWSENPAAGEQNYQPSAPPSRRDFRVRLTRQRRPSAGAGRAAARAEPGGLASGPAPLRPPPPPPPGGPLPAPRPPGRARGRRSPRWSPSSRPPARTPPGRGGRRARRR